MVLSDGGAETLLTEVVETVFTYPMTNTTTEMSTYTYVEQDVAICVRWDGGRQGWHVTHGNGATITFVPTQGSIVADADAIDRRVKNYLEAV